MTVPTTPSPERQPADAGGELLPCPFCGSGSVVPNQVSTDGGWGILCRSCHANQDTRAASPSLAADTWNRRTPAPQAQPDARAVEARPAAPTQSAAQTGEACRCSRCVNEAVAAEGGSGFDTRLMQMFLCTQCGNKRCPHATDHRLSCTNSNEAGQEGSSYGPPLYRRDQATLIEAQAAEIEGLRKAVEDLKDIREEAFRDGWRKGFTGAMNSGPLPDEDSDYLSYAKPTLTIVGE